jgi:hypothetical protein
MTSKAARRAVGILDCAWGIMLSIEGPTLWTRLSGRAPERWQVVAMRVLAGRHLVQGAALLARPERHGRLWGGVSALHAGTMFLAAVPRGPGRRPALVSGAYAAVAAVLTWPATGGRSR